MEIDFPNRRSLIDSFSEDGRSSILSDGDGFMAWPSSKSSVGSTYGDNHNGGDDQSLASELQTKQLQYAISSDNGDDNTVGTVAVEFPEDRTPFMRRKSSDSLHSVGDISGYNTGGSKGSVGGGGGGGGSDNDSSAAASRSASSMGKLQRMNSNSSINNSGRRSRRSSLSSSVGSNTSHNNMSSSLRGSVVRRRSNSTGKVEHRRSLATISSEQSMRNSGRGQRSNSGDFRKSLRESLVRQSSGSSRELRMSLDRKDREAHSPPSQTEPPQRRKSKEKMEPLRKSLTQLHDETLSALPLLGWDQDSDSSSFLSSSKQSKSMSVRSSFGPASINPRPAGLKGSGTSMNQSVSSSMKASQVDAYGSCDGLCEEFVPRGSFQKMMNENLAASNGGGLGPLPGREDNDYQNNTDLLKLMMEEEHDPRKPWRKAPPAGNVVVNKSGKNQQRGRPQLGRRSSGYTYRSSFTSDMSLGDLMQAPPLSNTAAKAIEEALGCGSEEESVDARSAGLTAVAVVTSIEAKDSSSQQQDGTVSVGGSDTIGDNTLRNSKISACSLGTSALSEDDDGSELTELRQAQDALFSVPESVDTSQRDDYDSESVTSSEIKEIHIVPDQLTSSTRSNTSNRSRTRDLSSLDIVQEERAQQHPHPSDQQQQQQQHLAPVRENGGGSDDGENKIEENVEDPLTGIDDLPLSAGFHKSMTKRSSTKVDDDSVSYSDIDVEPGQPQPSIKMCMNVHDSMIEREFATEQLADIEFGEIKEPDDPEMTLQDLLEGSTLRNDPIDASYHNLHDSMRSGNGTGSSRKSSSKRTLSTMSVGMVKMKNSAMKQTSKLDTKATRKLRRKNKRLYKFCVWNCRKITVCVILGLCILAGIAALAWWGAAKVTANKQANAAEEGSDPPLINVASDIDNNGANPTLAPARSESKQWPPVIDSGRNSTDVEPTQYPSSPPSLRGNNLKDVTPGVEVPTLDPAEQEAPSVSPSSANTITNIPSFTNSSRPTAPSAEPTYFNETGRLTDPSLAPSGTPSAYLVPNDNDLVTSSPSIHPSISPSLDDLNQDLSTYPSSSPSLEEKSVANTISVSAYPSSSPSNSTSYIQFPDSNASQASLYPSSSPSIHNSSFIPYQSSISLPSNMSSPSSLNASIAVSYPTSSPSNISSYQPSIQNLQFPNSSVDLINPTPSPSSNKSNVVEPQVVNVVVAPPPNDPESKYKSIQIVSGSQEFEYAGSAVSMSPTGEFIAVGFKEANSPTLESTGAVRVYKSNDDNTFSPLGQDSMFGTAARDEFGASVSIANDGRRVAVGARSSSISEEEQKNGQVSIHEYVEASNSWTQLGSSIQGSDEKDRLGFSVCLSGDGSRVAVGAPKGNGGTGSMSIYQYNGSDWILFGNIIVGDEVGDRAGFSLSLSNDGNTLAIGAFTSSTNGLTKNGSVSVYKLEGSVLDNSSSLVKQDQLLIGSTAEAEFGYSVAVSGNGLRLVVGSPGHSTANIAKAGLCEVYEIQSNTWTKIGALAGSIESQGIGSHVALSINGNAMSCSKLSTGGSPEEGAVTIVEETGIEWDTASSIVSSARNDSISFGSSVAISENGNMILTGAPLL